MKNCKGRQVQVVTICKGHITDTRQHHLNTVELLLQWMASIHAHIGVHNEDGKLKAYPKIVLVGTHYDHLLKLLKDKSPSEAKDSIAQSIRCQYEDKYYADLLMPSPFYFVDNTTAGMGDDEDRTYKELRETVHKFALNNFTVRTPVTWVLFRKVIQMIGQEKQKSVVSYEEALAIAEACFIPSVALPSVLNFYHELGVFLYYSKIADLQKTVFINPQWLINMFGRLLSPHGFEDEGRTRLWDLFRTKGIVVKKLYQEVLKNSEMAPQRFIDLLEFFCLAARIKTEDVHPYTGREYFIPSMLCASSLSPQTATSPVEAEPIHLVFDTNYVPPGFFVRLLTAIANEYRVLFERNIDRYKVDFALGYGRREELSVLESPCSISLSLHCFSDRSVIHPTCQEVLSLLQDCLTTVQKWISGMQPKLAFKCLNCSGTEEHFVLFKPSATSTGTIYLRCQKGKSYLPTSKQQPWLTTTQEVS